MSLPLADLTNLCLIVGQFLSKIIGKFVVDLCLVFKL